MRRFCGGLRLFLMAAALAAFFAVGITPGDAATVSDLRRMVDEKNEEIRQLEAEAAKYRAAIAISQGQQNTLKNELKRIDANIAAVRRDITITERKITKTRLEIDALGIEIREKETAVGTLKSGLAGLIETFAVEEQRTPLEVLLAHTALSGFFQQLDYMAFMRGKILSSVEALRSIAAELGDKKAEAGRKETELENLQAMLVGRQVVLTSERGDRNYLLAATKNEEKRYQELLAEQERKRAALEDEVRKIENEIRITIDPSSLPAKGSGVLGWPLPDLSLRSCWEKGITAKNCVTQYFGNTDFASRGAYSGKGHNGMDFRAETGTTVFAAESGTVTAIGDTDLGCRGASYGKWVLIKHPNGLSTLYAHLSAVSIAAGRSVERGAPIGLSGRSGYATGPHLHFTVFATQAVSVQSIKSATCGRMMTLPISATNGYLNPLDYL